MDKEKDITLDEFMAHLRARVDKWEAYVRAQAKLHPEREMLHPQWPGDWFEHFASWEDTSES